MRVRQWCRQRSHLLILGIVCALTYVVGMHRLPMTDPDEVFYAESAKEMLANHSFLTPMIFEHPQFEKPPLFFWLLMLSTTCFGMNVIGIRLVPAFFGALGVLATYTFVKRVASERIALYSGLILATSALYLGLSRGVLTDIVFTVCIMLSLYSFYLWYRFGRSSWLLGFAAASALAVLTKGPLGLAIPLSTVLVFLAITRDSRRYRAFVRHPGWMLLLALVLPWYWYAWKTYGQAFVGEFFVHDHWHRFLYAEHRQFDRWYFYPLAIVVGFFPWTGFLRTLAIRAQPYQTERRFLWCWVSIVVVSFGLAHSKLVSYILPTFPALAILLGISLDTAVARGNRMSVLGTIALTLGVIAIIVPCLLHTLVPPQYASWINWKTLSPSLAVFALMQIGVGVLLFTQRSHRAIWLTGIGCGCVVATLFTTLPGALLNGVTSEPLSRFIATSGYTGSILCSKQFARGVYFYTHHPVVVMDTSQTPFWSPHPLAVLSSDRELSNYFRRRAQVLSIISPKELDRIQKVTGQPWRTTVVSANPQRLIVLSEQPGAATRSSQAARSHRSDTSLASMNLP